MRLILPVAIASALTLAATVAFVWGENGAHAQSGNMEVSAAWARATPPGAGVGAAYGTIVNEGTTADRLVRVTSPAAEQASIHETVEHNGVAQMRPLDEGVPVAGGKTLVLAPGGLHIMLTGLRGPLKAGEVLPLTLVFEKVGPIALDLPILPVGAPGPAGAASADEDHSANSAAH
jgi:copper(I)-binding protein